MLLLLGLKKDFMSTVITVNTVIYQNMDASIITDWDTFVNIAQKYFELHLVEIWILQNYHKKIDNSE